MNKMAMKQIKALARVSFEELIREKILWSAFVFGLMCVALSYLVSRLSFAENARIALDFGLTAISIVGGLIAIVMGATLISKELQYRTHFLVLTKPVWKWQFVVGRLLGLLGVLAVNAAAMTTILIAVLLVSGGSMNLSIVKGLVLQVAEFAVLASIACIFSTFTTAALSAVITSGVWVIGHAMGDIRIIAQKIEPYFIRPVLRAVVEIFPDLTRFDIKAEIAHDVPVSFGYVFMTTGYSLMYFIFAIAIACFLFQRREL